MNTKTLLQNLLLLLLFVVFTNVANAQPPTKQNGTTEGVISNCLIGLWHLDGNPTDASGNGHNGTIEGTITQAAGKFNNAYHFDGNSAINCGNVDLNSTGQFTVSAWVKTTDPYFFEVWRMVVSKLGDVGGPLELFLGEGRTTTGLPGSATNYHAWNGGSSVYHAFSPFDPARNAKDGAWHHLAVTFKPGSQIVYFDGVQVGSSTSTDPLPNTQSDFRIGGMDFGPYHHPWIGEIDEVAAYSRALSPAEISILAGGVVVTCSNTPKMVSSFTLINADTDKGIQLIEDGSSIDINTLPTTKLNIRANVQNMPVNPSFKEPGSVVFILDGKQVRTEEGSPFAIAGDLPTGDYHAWTLPLGEHTLTAIPYERSNGGGLKGKSLTIHFNVIANTAFCAPSNSSNCPVPFDISVAKSELRNNGAGLSWNPIKGDIQLEIANEDFTVRYDTIFPNVRKNQFFSAIPLGATTPPNLPSHKFANGLYHWRIRLTCAKNGPWSSWICGPDFTIPYSAQISLSRAANNSNASVQKPEVNDQSKNPLILNINPNPAGNILKISTEGLPSKNKSTISILSISGVVIKTIETKTLNNLQLNISSLSAGTYFMKVINGDKVLYKQFVKL